MEYVPFGECFFCLGFFAIGVETLLIDRRERNTRTTFLVHFWLEGKGTRRADGSGAPVLSTGLRSVGCLGVRGLLRFTCCVSFEHVLPRDVRVLP